MDHYAKGWKIRLEEISVAFHITLLADENTLHHARSIQYWTARIMNSQG